MNGSGDMRMTKLALLIDGDNVSDNFMPLIMREATLLGTVAIRRLYGQFDSGRLKSWQKLLAEYDLTPVNVAPLTRGKNATDMKLVIEAMDMLHGRRLDGFCIASSDGDFTPLAGRIRASALAVYGFGAKKAPAGYKAVFDRFYECDTLLAAEKKAVIRRAPSAAPRPAPVKAAPARPTPKSAQKPKPSAVPPVVAGKSPIPSERIHAAIAKASGDGGWASSQKIGNALTAADPNFKIKLYATNMKQLLSRTPGVDVEPRGRETWARLKPQGA